MNFHPDPDGPANHMSSNRSVVNYDIISLYYFLNNVEYKVKMLIYSLAACGLMVSSYTKQQGKIGKTLESYAEQKFV